MTAEYHAKDLHGRWLHSHEEDTEGRAVYRPTGFRFPPARGRSGFELRPGGELLRLGPGPADRPQATAGRWRLDGDRLVLEPRAESPRTLRILSATPERLVVRA
jgi:hypothetical protein